MVRRLGGFPKLSVSAGVDNVLAQRIHLSGYRWKVDWSVKSIHLRAGLKDELAHYYWYGTCASGLGLILFNKPVNLKSVILRAFFQPYSRLRCGYTEKRSAGSVYLSADTF